MDFNPFNPVVKLCLQGIDLEENGKSDQANQVFHQAWNEASDDLEKFMAAYYVARYQTNISDKQDWLNTALQIALKINNGTVNSALPALYTNIAKCYDETGDTKNAQKYVDLSISSNDHPTDKGPFYHGTKAELKVDDLLTAGGNSNYQTDLKMDHIYFTGLVNGAGLAAALARGEGRERVYIVEPIGIFENDPNVTDKKFPGNPTRSYRSLSPLKVVGEIQDWVKISPEELQKWKEKLANNKGEIIN